MKRFPRTGAPCLLLIALLISGCSSFHENFLVRLFVPKSFEVGLWVQAEGANRTLDSAEKIKGAGEARARRRRYGHLRAGLPLGPRVVSHEAGR